MKTVTRHVLAAFVVLALVAPLMPAAGSAMACCRGTGEACACPVDLGFSSCQTQPPLSPPQVPLALLPPSLPDFSLRQSPRALILTSEASRSLAPRPLVPPPRS